ncbi:MAG: oligosaccharide flippase family protein [Hydrogenobacter sp.]
MIRNLSFVSFAFFYANLTGYIFHFFVSRSLGASGYGEFMVLYSLMLTVGNFINLFANACVREFVKYRENAHSLLRYMRYIGLFLGFMFLFVGVVLSPFLKEFLKISNLYYIWILAGVWFFQFPVVIERAYLQSLEKFKDISLSLVYEQSVRLISVFILIYSGLGLEGALISSSFGLSVALFLLLSKNRNFTGNIKSLPFKDILKTSLFASPVGFLVYSDDLFIRRVFDPHTAGLYASVSLTGKVFVWLTVTSVSVFFPKFVRYRKDMRAIKKLFFKAFLLVSLLFVVIEVLLFSFGKYVFVALFSEKFLPAYSFLPIYVLCILPLIFSLIFVYLLTALGRNMLLIYTHVLFYYAGFLVLPFYSINGYMFYIMFINLCFVLVYAFTLFQGERDSGKLKLPI